jgi:hypothetical protein
MSHQANLEPLNIFEFLLTVLVSKAAAFETKRTQDRHTPHH